MQVKLMQIATSVLCKLLTWQVVIRLKQSKVGLSRPMFLKFQINRLELNDQGRALQILG
jgi:hypothetical protein